MFRSQLFLASWRSRNASRDTGHALRRLRRPRHCAVALRGDESIVRQGVGDGLYQQASETIGGHAGCAGHRGWLERDVHCMYAV
jgi:hypothetical protein